MLPIAWKGAKPGDLWGVVVVFSKRKQVVAFSSSASVFHSRLFFLLILCHRKLLACGSISIHRNKSSPTNGFASDYDKWEYFKNFNTFTLLMQDPDSLNVTWNRFHQHFFYTISFIVPSSFQTLNYYFSAPEWRCKSVIWKRIGVCRMAVEILFLFLAEKVDNSRLHAQKTHSLNCGIIYVSPWATRCSRNQSFELYSRL